MGRVGQRGNLFCAKLQKEDRKVGHVRGEEYESVTSNVLTSSSRSWVVRKCKKSMFKSGKGRRGFCRDAFM